jgi:Cof subfamily protein (haloacid dehalogenase superfamily)
LTVILRHPRLVVLDVDGTLLDPLGNISERVRSAVEATRATGCLVTLASGRRLWAVRPIAEALNVDAPVILYNGAIIYSIEQDKAFISNHLQPDLLRESIGLVWESGYQPVVYGHPHTGEPVFMGPVERDSEATAHYFNRPTTQALRREFDELTEIPAPPLVAAMGEEAEMRNLASVAVTGAFSGSTLVERQTFVPGSRWWQLDLSARDCTKGSALRALCGLYGIDPQETVAVGDGINDLDLIRSAGLGIAMGNAISELKEIATVVVSDNAHDGAAEALERFILDPEIPILSSPVST